jgi:hypothetical protein
MASRIKDLRATMVGSSVDGDGGRNHWELSVLDRIGVKFRYLQNPKNGG